MNISWTLPRRFAVMMTVVVISTAFSAQMFYSRQARVDLETRLREKAAFINSFYAFLISDSLMRNDDVTLLQVVNRLEEDQEISSVIVVDKRNAIRYHADPHKVGNTLDDPAVKGALETGEATVSNFQNAGGKALMLVSPLKVQGIPKPIGAVRIDMTYHRIESQVESTRKRFWLFVVLGSIVSGIGLIVFFIHRWLLGPFDFLKKVLGAINPALPESNLPETPDELGQLHAAINDLVVRFKTENQQQWSTQQVRADQEKAWVQRLASSFLPGARLIVADKDNRILSDTGNGAPVASVLGHLMDLIKDVNFANLLSGAFQKEGEVVRGPVHFEGKAYTASILSVPLQQSIAVKTLIALQPN